MKMEIWSTLLVQDTSYYMETQPAHILVLIYDWGCIPEYNRYTGDTYLSLDDPGALAQEWSNFMCTRFMKYRTNQTEVSTYMATLKKQQYTVQDLQQEGLLGKEGLLRILD